MATCPEVGPAPEKPGRVYAYDADEAKGEISVAGGYGRIYILQGDWVRLAGSRRVEFDEATDEGVATVEACYIFNGQPQFGMDGRSPAIVRFRTIAKFEWAKPK